MWVQHSAAKDQSWIVIPEEMQRCLTTVQVRDQVHWENVG